MRLSQLIAKLQAVMADKGDTEEVGICLVMGAEKKYRRDAFGDIEVLHDTGEFTNGMTYLVADYKPRTGLAGRPQCQKGFRKKKADRDDETIHPRISHPKPGVTRHRCV